MSLPEFKSLKYLCLGIENAPDIALIHNYNGDIIAANKKAQINLGYTITELTSMKIIDIDTVFSGLSVLQKELDILDVQETIILYGNYKRKNDNTYKVEIHISSFKLQNKRFYIAFAKDINNIENSLKNNQPSLLEEKLSKINKDLYKTKEELTNANNLLSSILERIGDGFVAFDKKFNYTYVNSSGAKFLGRNTEDLIGKNYWLEYPEAKNTPFAKAYIKAMDLQEPIYLEEYYQHWDKWFTNKIYPSREGLSIFFSDITDRKTKEKELIKHQNELENIVKERTEELETANEELQTTNEVLFTQNKKITEQKNKLEALLQRLKKTQTGLIQAEKMASLGILTAGIAHEINNPINFVSVGAVNLDRDFKSLLAIVKEIEHIPEEEDLLKEKIKVLNKLKENHYFKNILQDIPQTIEDINEGVRRIIAIVHGLLLYSRSNNEQLQQVNIHESIDSALVLLRDKHKNRVDIIQNFDSSNKEIYCYPGQLNQVFINLLDNAIDAINEKGIITITTKFNKNETIISIRDTGMGIPQEIKTKITDPFFTTKEVGKGTGLGLSICQGIINKHKGTIEINSEEGNGSEFIITLPANNK